MDFWWMTLWQSALFQQLWIPLAECKAHLPGHVLWEKGAWPKESRRLRTSNPRSLPWNEKSTKLGPNCPNWKGEFCLNFIEGNAHNDHQGTWSEYKILHTFLSVNEEPFFWNCWGFIPSRRSILVECYLSMTDLELQDLGSFQDEHVGLRKVTLTFCMAVKDSFNVMGKMGINDRIIL